MKRVLQFSEWLTQEILEHVTHQQYVFTIPKIMRAYFKYEAAWENLPVCMADDKGVLW